MLFDKKTKLAWHASHAFPTWFFPPPAARHTPLPTHNLLKNIQSFFLLPLIRLSSHHPVSGIIFLSICFTFIALILSIFLIFKPYFWCAWNDFFWGCAFNKILLGFFYFCVGREQKSWGFFYEFFVLALVKNWELKVFSYQ